MYLPRKHNIFTNFLACYLYNFSFNVFLRCSLDIYEIAVGTSIVSRDSLAMEINMYMYVSVPHMQHQKQAGNNIQCQC